MAFLTDGGYIEVKHAAKKLGTTLSYLRRRCDEGHVPMAIRRYVWEGEWLRRRWFLPVDYQMPMGGVE